MANETSAHGLYDVQLDTEQDEEETPEQRDVLKRQQFEVRGHGEYPLRGAHLGAEGWGIPPLEVFLKKSGFPYHLA